MKNIAVKYLLGTICFFALFNACTSSKSSVSKTETAKTGIKELRYDDTTLFSEKSPYLMPYNRIIDGAGESVNFGDTDFENHSLDLVLIPNSNTVVVEDRYGVAFFNIETHALLYRFELPKNNPYNRLMSTFSGIKSIVSHDSTFIFWSAGERDSPKSSVLQGYWDGKTMRLVHAFNFKPFEPAKIALPNDITLRVEDGNLFLYAVLNGNSQLAKVRVDNGKTIFQIETGVAPYGVTLIDNRAFVTNWAGPKTETNSSRETAGVPWGSAYTDPKTGAMAQGTVSVIDIKNARVEREINVGLHPTAIIQSLDKKFIYVANGNSDYISVINAQTLLTVDSIFVGLFKENETLIGSTPNALALNADGTILYVANGLDNAIAVVQLGKNATTNGANANKVLGYIPTQAYPSGIVVNNNHLIITNLEAIGARAALKVNDQGAKSERAFNAHHQLASISFINVPDQKQLDSFTQKVKAQSLYLRAERIALTPRKNIAPQPVPERIGEPSVFKHVLYIIKENRTYDQVLGDIKEGDGMASLCIFGDSVTPNLHKIARDYALLDNYHASGKSSAEGHHWASAAIVTDYTEKSVRAWFRSYPHVLYDALVYDKNGLIWNNALDHGKTVRLYGEACTTHFDEKTYDWNSLYALETKNKSFTFDNTTTIGRVKPILSKTFPGCDNETISDQMRADDFLNEFNTISNSPDGKLPNLMVMSLPNDHTSGMSPKFPTPRAMVADNDLAVGRIVEAVMHSRFADSTVIFISEDDSQNGWDHVSAYRTTGYVISKYSRLQKTVHTNYNQTSLVRTIEHILGLPPMNIIDATATPMTNCFTTTIDTAYSFSAKKNLIALNEMNKSAKELKGAARKFTEQSEKYVFNLIDRGHDNLLNRIIWYSVKNNVPYPAHLAGTDDDD